MNVAIREFIVQSGDGDTWGDAMSAFFSVAAAFYLNGGMGLAATYQPWGYRPGPLLRDDAARREEDWLMAEILRLLDDGELTMPELRHTGDVLNRYTSMLRTAGLDY